MSKHAIESARKGKPYMILAHFQFNTWSHTESPPSNPIPKVGFIGLILSRVLVVRVFHMVYYPQIGVGQKPLNPTQPGFYGSLYLPLDLSQSPSSAEFTCSAQTNQKNQIERHFPIHMKLDCFINVDL